MKNNVYNFEDIWARELTQVYSPTTMFQNELIGEPRVIRWNVI